MQLYFGGIIMSILVTGGAGFIGKQEYNIIKMKRGDYYNCYDY